MKSYSNQTHLGLKIAFAVLTALLLSLSQNCFATSIREKIAERHAQQSEMTQDEGINWQGNLPEGVKVIRDISYGAHARQKFDVYLPQAAVSNMPVILMVHGGAWSFGDKAARGVVKNKVMHWVPKGFIFISMNYRMLPDTKPLQQADDVARALAFAQSKAASWGGDQSQFILMGHSAGAHLVSMLAASPAISAKYEALPWLATIALDSAVYDLTKIMETRHYRFYDNAFGDSPGNWLANSPLQMLSPAGAPVLAVCSSTRADHPCLQADSFVARALSLGRQATVLPLALSHKEINEQLGEENAYTKSVDQFIASLHPSLSSHFNKK